MKNGPLSGTLNRRELLRAAVGRAAFVSAFPTIGFAFAESRTEGLGQRIRENFDLGWKFGRGDFPGAELPEFSESDWRTLDLPHDWSIEGPFDEKEPSSFCGAYLPTGIGWYRKRFRLPDSYPNSYKDKKLTIEFDGVYQNSDVW